LDANDLGGTPHIQGTGRRTDYEEIFKEVESGNKTNVSPVVLKVWWMMSVVELRSQKSGNKLLRSL